MSVKAALLFGIIIAVSLLLLTWLIGHAWVFAIMVSSTLVAISVASYRDGKAPSQDDEKSKNN